jgi:hypothetical protein
MSNPDIPSQAHASKRNKAWLALGGKPILDFLSFRGHWETTFPGHPMRGCVIASFQVAKGRPIPGPMCHILTKV